MAKNPYTNEIGARTVTPQSEPIRGRETEMHQMESGGFAFKKGAFGQLRRWLIVGSDKNEFYSTAQKLTKDNAANVLAAFAEDPIRTVDTIVDVSDRGLAPKNDAAVFALALCLELASRGAINAHEVAKKTADALGEDAAAALSEDAADAEQIVAYVQLAAPKVCRIGTHLFQFATFLNALGILSNVRGRQAINTILETWNFYGLQLNMIKYRSRDGWTLAQLLDLVHPKTSDPLRGAAYQWANWAEDRVRSIGRVEGHIEEPTGLLPENTVIWLGYKNGPRKTYNINWETDTPLIWAFEQLRKESNKARVINLITDYKLPWETLPDNWLNDKDVWAALMQHMGLTALIRNLGKLTNLGVIGQTGQEKLLAIKKLTDEKELHKARIHPLNVLVAQMVYKQGHGDNNKKQQPGRTPLTWSPVQGITSALEKAFYGSFEAWEPTEKSRGLFIDVSGSMTSVIYGLGATSVSACMVATVMAMTVAKKEPDHVIYGFADNLRDLHITADDSLETAMRKAQDHNFGATDATAAINWAIKNRVKLDTFEFYTDGQTWYGKEHVTQAFTRYRAMTGNPSAKLMMLAITSSPWTFADPKDRMQADFPGFGSDTPKLMEMFIKGELDVETD